MRFTLSSVTATLALASQTLAAALPDMTVDERYLVRRALRTGQGTRYGDDSTEEDCWQGGACSFTHYELPASIDGSTCVSEDIWNDGYNCGGCIEVSYQGKKITVMVTNLTGGDKNHHEMTPDTWAKLTNNNPGGGVDGIEWEFVQCPIPKSDPLRIHMHGGASQYWFSATVENANRRTSKMEVSTDSGKTWKVASRKGNDYNMFELEGTLPTTTAWVRVTSHVGTVVMFKNVVLASDKTTKGTANYA
ncbi:hypothetical protein LTR09_012247 [Extremus antarcticus]|uniref:Expansin-like EG45 domain-containing protein n=1 Tax=Extremus antarcticus TaxID=702011 RepID=A0AAJ0D5C8_9PEZI|nr:hypothetical protein LTR09_012247 [Extremus antarcticus]